MSRPVQIARGFLSFAKRSVKATVQIFRVFFVCIKEALQVTFRYLSLRYIIYGNRLSFSSFQNYTVGAKCLLSLCFMRRVFLKGRNFGCILMSASLPIQVLTVMLTFFLFKGKVGVHLVVTVPISAYILFTFVRCLGSPAVVKQAETPIAQPQVRPPCF